MDPRSFEPSFFRPSSTNLAPPPHHLNQEPRVPPPAHGGSIAKRSSHGLNSNNSSSNSSATLLSSSSSSSAAASSLLSLSMEHHHRSLTPASASTSSSSSDHSRILNVKESTSSSSSSAAAAGTAATVTTMSGPAGLWRPPSLSPKHHLPPSSSPLFTSRPMDGRTSAPPAAHQSSSTSASPAAIVTSHHHALTALGHLPPPPLPPPPHLQRISGSPLSSAGGSRSNSVPNPIVTGGINLQRDQHRKEFVSTSSPAHHHIQHTSHHIYSPIPGYSATPAVNGTTTSTSTHVINSGVRINGQPPVLSSPSSNSRQPQSQATNSTTTNNSKSSTMSNFMSVDSLISNSNNSLRSSPSTSFPSSSSRSSASVNQQQQELGHHLRQLSTTTPSTASSSSSSSGSKPDLNKKQTETSSSSSPHHSSHWSPGNNTSRSSSSSSLGISSSPSNSSSIRTMNPASAATFPHLIPGVIPGMITTAGSHIVHHSAPTSQQQFNVTAQYHPAYLRHPASLKSSSGHPSSSTLIVPPAAHQPLTSSSSLANNSQGINMNKHPLHHSRPLISNSMSSGSGQHKSSHGSSKNESNSKKLKSSGQGSNQIDLSGQRAPVLMFPSHGTSPYAPPPPHAHPFGGHHQLQTSSMTYQQHQQLLAAQQFNPIQLVQHRSPPESGIKSQLPPHNLLPGNMSQACDNKNPNNNNNSSSSSPFSSLSNHPFNLSVTSNQRSSSNNSNSHHHQTSNYHHDSVLFDGSKKQGRKSESLSMNDSNSSDQGNNHHHLNQNHHGSSSVPSTSVSPTNSNHSSHSNSGSGAKSVKKFWVQKYLDTTGNNNNGANNNISDVGSKSDVTMSTPPSSLSSISPGGASTPSNSIVQEKGDVLSGKRTPSGGGKKGPKTMKIGTKGQKGGVGDNCAGSEAASSEESSDKSDEKKMTKKKVRKNAAAGGGGGGDESRKIGGKSGTKRPASSSSSAVAGGAGKEKKQKVAGKKKKVTDSGIEEETESDSTATQSSSSAVDNKNGTASVVGSNKNSSNKEMMMIVDSEMTDVEEEDESGTTSAPTSMRKETSLPGDDTSPAPVKVPAKRGRKPKASKQLKQDNNNDGDDENNVNSSESTGKKNSKTTDSKKSVREKYTAEIMSNKSGLPFLQSKSCSEIAPVKSTILTRCRECKMTPYQKRIKEVGPSIFCRFYQFRKLFFHKELRASGFSEPNDAKEEDLKIWMPPNDPNQEALKKSDAQFLIEFVGDHFCNLVSQERRALTLHKGHHYNGVINGATAWKSVVAGVREMCDVCDTTLFNIHWVCSDCGFVVCIDCYKSRLDEEEKEKDALNKSGSTDTSSPSTTPERPAAKDRDKYNWLLCNSRQNHHQDKLMLTQIIAKSALWQVCLRLHHVKKVHLKSQCKCSNDDESLLKLIHASNIPSPQQSSITKLSQSNNLLDANGSNGSNAVKMEQNTPSPLAILADVAIGNSDTHNNNKTPIKTERKSVDGKDGADGEDFSALRELLSKPAPPSGTSSTKGGKKGPKKKQLMVTQLNGVLKHEDSQDDDEGSKLNFFSRKITPIFTSKNLPSRACSIDETTKKFPDIPHDWFCDGRLLVLKDTGIESNLQLFEQQWLRHQVCINFTFLSMNLVEKISQYCLLLTSIFCFLLLS